MFLRTTIRNKHGKAHKYFSIVENKRLVDGRIAQRHVLYLGKISECQALAWRQSIEVLEEGQAKPRLLSLFDADHCETQSRDQSGGGSAVEGVALVAATAVGRVLVGGEVVARVGTGSVLGRATGDQPQRDALGGCAVGAGGADCSGQ